eukprot:Sspe_Gene.97051::Locus_70714_Transcript_1_1_Confidence_1.000_Length_1015::g.97051::m.97051
MVRSPPSRSLTCRERLAVESAGREVAKGDGELLLYASVTGETYPLYLPLDSSFGVARGELAKYVPCVAGSGQFVHGNQPIPDYLLISDTEVGCEGLVEVVFPRPEVVAVSSRITVEELEDGDLRLTCTGLLEKESVAVIGPVNRNWTVSVERKRYDALQYIGVTTQDSWDRLDFDDYHNFGPDCLLLHDDDGFAGTGSKAGGFRMWHRGWYTGDRIHVDISQSGYIDFRINTDNSTPVAFGNVGAPVYLMVVMYNTGSQLRVRLRND